MDKALKQRLVGASVLVALAVVVLPMLLGGQPGGPQEPRSIELPPKPADLNFETRRFPIGEQPPGEPSTLPEPPPDSAAATQVEPALSRDANTSAGATQALPPVEAAPGVTISAAPAPGEDGADADPDGDVAPAQTPEPLLEQAVQTPAGTEEAIAETSEPAEDLVVIPAPRATPEGRYLVQVASFSSSSNANRLSGLLRDNGLPVLMDTVETAAGRLHRVRVGPYADRETADRAISTLNASVPDLNPRILDQRPDEAAAVAEPSDPLVRWVVQVGSFGERANADKLVFQLRDAGYRASAAAVTNSAGATAWKVRVGPTIERSEAVTLAANIQRDLGLEGLVMSAD